MRSSDVAGRHRPSGTWAGLAAAGLMALALAGCGGGDDGAAGPAGPPGATGPAGTPGTPAPTPTASNAVNVGSNLTTPSAATTAAWAALAPQITVTGVTIASAPVVRFTVTDAAGNPVVGLSNKSQAATATVASLPNLAFTLAKLVPAQTGTVSGKTINTEPSKWVSYNVTRPPTKAEKTAAPDIAWYGTYPTTDAQGTLVDNGDGSYVYTFLRDPKQAAAQVAALVDAPAAYKYKADLGDVGFDASLTHRLGIQLGGNAPGTGSNTPDGVTRVTAVPIGEAANVVYDFRPDGGTVAAKRDIVDPASCGNCHEGKVLAHGSRKDPNYCATCHTDQIRYSFSMEAPASGYTLTGGVTGTTAQKRAETAVVGGQAVGDWPNFMHKLHMGARLVKQGYNFNANGGAMMFNQVKLPQNVLNCTSCHDGSAGAANVTAQGDNWKSNPSALACGACHDGIDFKTGTGSTLADKAADLAASRAIGTTQSGHPARGQANNGACALCHDATAMVAQHTAKLPTTADATKRTMSATIKGVTVSSTDGSVTVNFTVADGGVAVTDITKFTKPAFGLVKLAPAVNGKGGNWVSYTGRFRTKTAAMAPVLQGSTENAGTLTAEADGSFNYRFALLNGSTPGDIRTIDHAHNVSTGVGAYTGASWTGAGAAIAGTGVNVVPFEATVTHRVVMSFTKIGTPNVDNATNATYDFVPSGAAVTARRNVVTMASCASCHAGSKLHSGYAVEYCVACHNSSTADPFTAETVDLQRLVHKIHMGKDLPSVIAGGTYVVNGTHDYTKAGYPGRVENCASCHDANAVKPGTSTKLENAANWYTVPNKAACATCHDAPASIAHMDVNISAAGYETCVTCHGPNASSGVDVRKVHAK